VYRIKKLKNRHWRKKRAIKIIIIIINIQLKSVDTWVFTMLKYNVRGSFSMQEPVAHPARAGH
jgi:hypothetical protein